MKMKKIQKITAVLTIATAFLTGIIEGRVRTKQFGREFDQQIAKSQLMIALFYNNGKNKQKGSAKKADIDRLLRMYESVSSKKLYDDADLTFVKVNVDVQGGGMIAQRYGIKELPAFLLFDNKRIVTDENDNNAMLFGFVSADQLHSFIQQYCGESIIAAVEQKEIKRDERIQASHDPSDPYFYPAIVYTPSGDLSSWTKPLKYSSSSDEI